MAMNNESIGISAEVAIAKSYNIFINETYAARAEQKYIDLLMKNNCIRRIFEEENIPMPKEHIAEGQNPIDFKLDGDKSLSVKTNQNEIGRAAPQHIGQPTQKSYFKYLEDNNIIPGFNIIDELHKNNLVDNYENRGRIFKMLSIEKIDVLINMYWKNMFDCDYLILFYNLETLENPIYNYKVFGKIGSYPKWKKDSFTFTQTAETWNESNTLKYCGISIGNFQVHRNRDCFKFRFDMGGIMRLINSREL